MSCVCCTAKYIGWIIRTSTIRTRTVQNNVTLSFCNLSKANFFLRKCGNYKAMFLNCLYFDYIFLRYQPLKTVLYLLMLLQ
jgi:hypothetical protein